MTVLVASRLVCCTGHTEHLNASDFKARCLALLDRVQQTGQTITILKRGKRVNRRRRSDSAPRVVPR